MEETKLTEDNEAAQAGVAQAPSALERHLDLALSAADLEKEVGLRLKRIGKTLKVDGFRPGKAPEKIVRQQRGEQTRYEVLNEMLEKAFSGAVLAQNLRVAGYPKISEKEGTENPENLEFSAVFEIFPDIKPGDLTDIEIKRPVLEIGQAEVDKTLEILRRQRTRYDIVDRSVEMGDQVKLDFSGKKNGAPFPGGDSKDAVFIVGEGSMLPEFEKAIIGLKAGETRSSEVTFPEKYFAKELEGQTVTFDIDLKEVRQPVLPDLDDDFAKALGIGDGDIGKMRAEIEANLKREVKKRLQERVKEQVMDAILKVTPIDIPNSLVEMEAHDLMRSAIEDLERRGGVQAKDIPIRPEWFADKAKRRVGLGLILSEIIKSNDLKATPAQVRAVVDEMAQGYEKPEEVVHWYYAEQKRLSDIEATVVEGNVVTWALDNAKVVDESVDFDELMGQKSRPFAAPGMPRGETQ
ncbi:MAG: trigger factor [Candidatus Accumulibacter sp.]|jgi:trigger factor|nr:trigger factor [Accumulibacter sp.]